jgi:hypothetical protein
MDEFYQSKKVMCNEYDRAKEWKKKNKKGYKPRIFNEKEIGSKPVAKDMDKI